MALLNGRLPADQLRPTVIGGRLRADAAASADRLAAAFQAAHGVLLRATDTYRTYDQQVDVKKRKGSYAATPGTSTHGWGLAVDFASGINVDTSPAHRWMEAHASEYGWVNPAWATNSDPRDGQYEPWHWEYHPELDRHRGDIAASAIQQCRDITALQRALHTTPDNISGPDTRTRAAAVRAASKWGGRQFPYGVAVAQQAVGANPDGEWGRVSAQSHDSTVADIQRALGITADGIYGAVTDAAVTAALAAARQE